MTLAADGTISGAVTYTTLIISVTELPLGARIYPNPVSDLLYLEVPGIDSYRLYDLSGRLVKAGTITENQPLSLSGLSSGMFRLQMMVGEKSYFGKIVKR
jgi:hypothetical protein